ncbi:methionine biosynthesis protein MetW [Gammaproteobacteria bacterium 45_16_T64]|nr:methionine biosynthesis protein MetW [Gammaproteobacteria bacterium 45_16_T64]
MNAQKALRSDLNTIIDWIEPESRVLDLGCGDGTLLDQLKQHRNIHGYGLEINPDQIVECVRKGVNVIEHNMDESLSNFKTDSFDMVVMTQALQAVHYPDHVIDEMLRIGKECIVTFPNFAHWRCRFYLLTKGRMPVSKNLPYTWYNTPNIHLCTFKDFEALCHRKSLSILDRTVIDANANASLASKLMPNLFGETAIYHITRHHE